MDFAAKFNKLWYALFTKGNGDGYVKVITGLKNTAVIAVVGLVIGIFIGTLIAVVRVVPKTNKFVKALDKICTVYVAFFRGTPMVAQLLLGYYVFLPLIHVKLSSLGVCILIFGLNSGAYVSEIMRSGLQSVDIGQTEAGRALGLSFAQTMMRIVVPQAVKNILPTLGNEFITLIKETSIVSFVGAVDLYSAFNYIGSANYEYMMPYLAMALIYIVLVLMISGLVKLMERSLRAGDKR